MNKNDLERFVEAQAQMYAYALEEIKNGRKRSHWMWYIFPQIRGLGRSAMAYEYGIKNLDEAKEYLKHPILSKNLVEITEVLLSLDEKHPQVIFGGIDAMKLCSCMTLFAIASEEENTIYHKALEKYFQGKMDQKTIELLNLA